MSNLTVFVVIETNEEELFRVEVFNEYEDAEKLFEQICYEGELIEHFIRKERVLDGEVHGTRRIAGDDVNCVQIVERITQ
jgi:hypothetical protein